MKEYKCYFNAPYSDISEVKLDIICESGSDGDVLSLDVSTMRAVHISYDYSYVKKYELVVEVVAGKLLRRRNAELEDSVPPRTFHSSLLHANKVGGAEESKSMTAGRADTTGFYYVDDGSDNNKDPSGDDLSDHLISPAIMVDDNTHTGKKKKWYPGKLLFRGGKAAAGAVINTMGHTVSTTKNVVSTVAVGAGASVVHGMETTTCINLWQCFTCIYVVFIVGEGMVEVVKGVGSTGVKVIKGTVKGVVATAETTVDLATGKESAERIANLVAVGAKDGAISLTNKSRDIARGKLISECKSSIIVRSPLTRDIQTDAIVGATPFWNDIYTLPVDKPDLKSCIEDDSLGLSMFLMQGKDDDCVTDSTYVPIRHLLFSPEQIESMKKGEIQPRDLLQQLLPRGRCGETPLRQIEVPFGSPYLESVLNAPTASTCIALDFTVLGANNLTFPVIDTSMEQIESAKFPSLVNLASSDSESVPLQV